FHLSSGVDVPSAVLRIEVVCTAIIVTRLHHQVQVGILSHGSAQVVACPLVASVPRVDRTEEIVCQVSIKLQRILRIYLKCRSEGVVPAGQSRIKIRRTSGVHSINSLITTVQPTDRHPVTL